MVGVAGAAIGGAVISGVGAALTDTDAGADAARAQVVLQGEGIKTLTGEQARLAGQFDPFIQAGLGGLQGQVQGSTVAGLDQSLGQIFGSENFQNLAAERGRAVENRNAAGGNFRSGAGLLDAARVPTELGFEIENLLSGRQAGLAGQGLGAISNLGQFGANAAQGIAGLQAGQGQALAQGSLIDAEASAGKKDALFGAASSLLGGVGGLF